MSMPGHGEEPEWLERAQEWVGRTEEAEEVLTLALVRRFLVTVGLPSGKPLADGDPAPAGIHWCIGPTAWPAEELGPDGHPALGTIMPPMPFTRQADNPAVPISPAEQIESTQEAFEAGASLVHIHVRSPDGAPSSEPELFSQVKEGISRHCPGMVIQFSTGGRGREPGTRSRPLHLRPDMGSLATGSVNFPTRVYDNDAKLVDEIAAALRQHEAKPEIELFDLSHVHGARQLIDKGLIPAQPHVQFVMGIKNAMPAYEHLVDVFLSETRRFLPDATWAAAGIGRMQFPVMEWALQRGCDAVRTGLEDNVRVSKTQLASSNAELVRIAVDLCEKHDARPATPAEARLTLGLRQVGRH